MYATTIYVNKKCQQAKMQLLNILDIFVHDFQEI